MQFRKGVKVRATNGANLGEVDRVVIDPRTGKVSHLVVRRSFFSNDKVIPVNLVQRTDDTHVWLNVGEDQAADFLDYIEMNFVPLSEEEIAQQGLQADNAVPVYWYPMVGASPTMWGTGAMGIIPSTGVSPYRLDEKQNIPQGSVALQEGAKVFSKDGQHLGDLEKVLVEDEQDRVTHLLITKGLLNRQKRLIPAHWISAIKEDGVKLSVTADFVLQLQDYKAG